MYVLGILSNDHIENTICRYNLSLFMDDIISPFVTHGSRFIRFSLTFIVLEEIPLHMHKSMY